MFNNKFSKLAILLLIINFLLLPAKVLAEDQIQITKSTINPDSIFYYIDRALEKLLLYIQFTKDSKITYYQSLLDERFAELDYIAGNKKLGQFETSSKRFAAQAGVLVEYLENNKLEKEKEQVRNTLIKYRDYLPKLRDLYEANNSFWLLIQQDIDSLSLYLERLR